jgi:hypothetical protein
MSSTDTTTRAAAAIAAADDAASVREASVAAAAAATITLRDLAELASWASTLADELTAVLNAASEDPNEVAVLAARVGTVVDSVRINAVSARQNLTLAAEGIDVLRSERWCDECGDVLSDGSPDDVCGSCYLAPFGPAWEAEQREAFGW